MAVRRRSLAHSLALLALLAGCPSPTPPRPEVELKPPARAVPAWPPAVLERIPGQFPLPWPLPPGAHTEVWRVDLLDLDRPEVPAWLEQWQPAASVLARHPAPQKATVRQGILRVGEPGAYVVRTVSPGRARAALVLASRLRIGLLLGDSDFEVLCTQAPTGEPVQGAFVKVVYRTERLGRERVLSASGTTDSAGRWHSSLVRDRFAPSVVATAVATHGDHGAVATARRRLDHSAAVYRVRLRARRSTFRPGSQAHFTGVLQLRAEDGFAPLTNTPAELTLVGPSGLPVAAAQVRTDAVGAFTDSFSIPRDASPGAYAAIVAPGGERRLETQRLELLRVEAPRPAPFRVALSASRPVARPGEAVELRLRAEDAEGQPLPDARVRFLSWAYPVGLEQQAGWAEGEAPLDEERLEVLPLDLPAEARTDEKGELSLRWQPTRAEQPDHDALCAVHAAIVAPPMGEASATAEFLVLAEAPPAALEVQRRLYRVSEAIPLGVRSPLPPPQQAAMRAACSAHIVSAGGRTETARVVEGTVASLVERDLSVPAPRPGRYTFVLEAGGGRSQVAVWVAEDGCDLPRGEDASRPRLVVERPWVRRGEEVLAVATAPRARGHLALTLRSGGVVRRRSLELTTGARALALRAGPDFADPLEVTLVQMAHGGPRVGRAEVGIEPGGRALDVSAKMLWVKRGEWSGRGYGINTRSRLGGRVQSVVGMEVVRPRFRGCPPSGVERETLQWYHGKATNVEGEMKVGFAAALLESSYALFIQALAPDGRAGALLMPIQEPGRAPDAPPGRRRSAGEKLDLLAQHGLDAPVARWLARQLLRREPKLARRLPAYVAEAPSDAAALAALRLAADHPGVRQEALQAALQREAIVPQALAVAADFSADVLDALEGALDSDARPAARLAAIQALASALPASHRSLARTLRDGDLLARRAAAAALARGGPQAVRTLAEAAEAEQEPEVRLAIVGALRELGGERAAAALLDMAAGPDDLATPPALRALAAIGYRGADPRLTRVLRRGPAGAREEAARLLVGSGDPQALGVVLVAAQRQPTGPLVAALGAARTPQVREAMARWLDHDDPGVRLAAAEALARETDPRARPALRQFLELSQPRERADRAARALLAWPDPVAADKLVRLLEEGRLSPPTSLEVVRKAGRLGWQQAGRALLAILRKGLVEPRTLRQPAQRRLWAEALDAAASIGPIWEGHREEAAGQAAPDSLYAPALRALDDRGLGGLLEALWWSPLPPDLRRRTVLPYARLQGPRATDELVALLGAPTLQAEAARALARLGATDALLGALRHPSARRRSAAAAALGATGELRAVPDLRARLDDDDPAVRLEAAWALAALTGRAVVYTDHLGQARQALPRERRTP
ncbi:MAG: HEAT repeat domain-containing protein [Candidatus Brocadiia bacterium]